MEEKVEQLKAWFDEWRTLADMLDNDCYNETYGCLDFGTYEWISWTLKLLFLNARHQLGVSFVLPSGVGDIYINRCSDFYMDENLDIGITLSCSIVDGLNYYGWSLQAVYDEDVVTCLPKEVVDLVDRRLIDEEHEDYYFFLLKNTELINYIHDDKRLGNEIISLLKSFSNTIGFRTAENLFDSTNLLFTENAIYIGQYYTDLSYSSMLGLSLNFETYIVFNEIDKLIKNRRRLYAL